MILGLIAILLCQLVGEVVVRTLDLPLPGPVLGMLLLLIVLRVRRVSPDRGPIATAAAPLLRHLQLLFVPAGVGVIVLLSELRADWLPISVGLWGSWLIGLVVTGWTVTLLIRIFERRGGESK
jgi:holin-like protein